MYNRFYLVFLVNPRWRHQVHSLMLRTWSIRCFYPPSFTESTILSVVHEYLTCFFLPWPNNTITVKDLSPSDPLLSKPSPYPLVHFITFTTEPLRISSRFVSTVLRLTCSPVSSPSIDFYTSHRVFWGLPCGERFGLGSKVCVRKGQSVTLWPYPSTRSNALPFGPFWHKL